MKEFEYVLTDPLGIHARPAGLLVKEAAKFKSSVKIGKAGTSADAKRIFGVMGLQAKQGDTVKFTVEGEDEDAAAQALEAFMKANL